MFSSFGPTRVAVVGDFCLDAYWEINGGDAEFSIETGLPVHRVTSQRYSPGGAGNVVANIVSLGVGQVRAIGLYGGDPFGRALVELLAELGADTSGMLDLGADWQTLVTPSRTSAPRSKAGSISARGLRSRKALCAFLGT